MQQQLVTAIKHAEAAKILDKLAATVDDVDEDLLGGYLQVCDGMLSSGFRLPRGAASADRFPQLAQYSDGVRPTRRGRSDFQQLEPAVRAALTGVAGPEWFAAVSTAGGTATSTSKGCSAMRPARRSRRRRIPLPRVRRRPRAPRGSARAEFPSASGRR